MLNLSLHDYIHHSDSYDSLVIALESGMDAIVRAQYDYNDDIRKAKQKYVFESVDSEYYTEDTNTAKEGLFAKIGRKVMELIEKFRVFITDTIDKVRGVFDSKQKEVNDVKKVMKEHPELARQMTAAMECPDMSLKDVKEFNSQCIALIESYKASKDMDEETFKSKFNSIIDNFNNKENKGKKTLKTITEIIGVFAATVTAILGFKNALNDLNKEGEKFKRYLDDEKVYQHGKAAAIYAALNRLIGIQTKAFYERRTIQERMGALISKVNKQWGDKIINKVQSEKDANHNAVDRHDLQKEVNRRAEEEEKVARQAELEAVKQHAKEHRLNQLNHNI